MRTTNGTRFLQFLCILLLTLAPIGAHAACWQWSTTASNNAGVDPSINWAEGMAPSGVNDSARAMMARLAECRDDISGKLTTAGSSTAFTLATEQGSIASPPLDGQQLAFRLHATNGAAATLAVDGGTAFPIQTAPAVAVSAGTLVLGAPYRVTYSTAASAWILQGFYNAPIAAGSIVTSMLADNSVTYQKIQKPGATSRLLGTPSLASTAVAGAANNGSGLIRLTVASTTGLTTGQTKVVSGVTGTTEANGTWTLTVIDGTHVDLQGSAFANVYVSGGAVGGSVENITLGTGLGMNGNTIFAAPAPPSSFKNLAIKVTGNTTATVTADYVVTTNGTAFQTTPVSCSMNLGSTGALGLDTGSIATSSWYGVWINVKADGTTTCTASLKFTADATFISNMPSGYTYYARVGALRTASGVAQLMGTWQFNRRAEYIVGLAQTSNYPLMISGTSGSLTVGGMTSVAVGSFVPTTASAIHLMIIGQYNGGSIGTIQVAPTNTLGNPTTSTNPGPLAVDSTRISLPGTMVLQSSNVFYASTSGGALMDIGWEDNL